MSQPHPAAVMCCRPAGAQAVIVHRLRAELAIVAQALLAHEGIAASVVSMLHQCV
jgi:hypothetical protein